MYISILEWEECVDLRLLGRGLLISGLQWEGHINVKVMGNRLLISGRKGKSLFISGLEWEELVELRMYFIYFFRHVFHKMCVDPWLNEHCTCPMCKLNILKALGIMVSTHTWALKH